MSHDDPARDPHLDTALRHAPDHDAAPPPALSRAILQAARAAASPPRPWWRRWLEVQPMQWAGVAAGLLVAVLGGRLWWDNPPELREPAPTPAPTQQAPRAEVPPPAAAPEAAASPPAAPMQEALKAAPPAPQRHAEERQAAAADKAMAAPPAPPAPAPAPAPAPVVVQKPAADVAPAAAAPTAPRGLAQDTGHPPEAAFGEAGASQRRLAPAVKSAAAGALVAEPPGVQRLREASAARTSWSWERRAPPAAAENAVAVRPLQAWLQQLLQASSGRWVPKAGTAQPPGESLSWIGTWREDGELRAIVSLQGRQLWWREPDGRTWTATLEPAAAEALSLPPP